MSRPREHWGSQLGFVLAAAGSAIGLGSLWRFPYIAGENGGGAFVILYLLFTFLIGVPIFIGELLMGRTAQKSPVGAYAELSHYSRNWKLAGWLAVFSCFTVLSFYNVISGWTLNYALMSLNQFTKGRSPAEIQEVFHTLRASGDICIFWHFLFITITAGVVYGGIKKGIEYWSKLLMPLLLTLLLALFVYACTLDGFGQAVRFVFYPDFSQVTPKTILQALSMALFTLSVGVGIIITYGSYLQKDDNIPKTALIIQAVNISITLIASLVIFPIVFTFGLEPEAGMGLVFKTLPVLFEQLPGTILLSTMFFALMVFTALTSTISLFEVIVANFIELLGWSRKKSALVLGSACFLFGIPSALADSDTLFANWKELYGLSFLETVSELCDWQFPIGGLLVCIFIGWVIDKKLLQKEFSQGSKVGAAFFTPWLTMVRWAVPAAIIAILLQQAEIISL